MVDQLVIYENDTKLRIVSKSAVGNTILGRKAFESELSLSSVTSACKKETNYFDGLNLAVIDTPGLFDTDKSNKEVVEEIAKCIYMAAPGPHVFLVVLQPTRFIAEERETVEIIQTMFGEKAARYTMILFTHGDLMREENTNIEEMLETFQPLKHIISQCSILQKLEDKYHVFGNKVKDPRQIKGLLQKINRMIQQNGGSYYLNEIFEKAERAKQEEINSRIFLTQLIRENPDIDPEVARKQAETDNSFIRDFLEAAGAGAAAGAAAGTVVGDVGGPVGIVIGGGIGVYVGVFIGAAAAVNEKGCSTQ
ncbi:GTPase IMAP family member 4-like [Xiphophorus maculatus]|uniref:GTPase IMAP family member 4-like n=1 Tax=Xiphophorus maculatus TaxID=8083 RepID=UPI000C6D8C1D|nr:GTPase IMAP family member 4-like [Xiphophorus maculatus]